MRPAASTLMVVVVLSLCACASAQGVFSLNKQAIKGEESDPFSMLTLRLDEIKGLPPDLPKSLDRSVAVAFSMHAADKDVVLVIEATEDPQLYVDLDQDGALSDERPVASRSGWSLKRFGPVTLAVPGSNRQLSVRLYVRALISDGRVFNASAFPAGCRAGTVRLGGTGYKIALADADYNGLYNEPCASFSGDYSRVDDDCIAIDLDGNGQFDPVLETCPLSRMIRVRGTCYELAVTPDGSKVRLRAVKPRFELGVLDTRCAEAQLVLFSPELGLLHLGGTQGKWQLPAGEYTLMDSHLARRDPSGTLWLLKRKWSDQQRPVHKIAAGETLTLQLGQPLRAESRATYIEDRGVALISLSFIGAGDETYANAAERNGEKADAPRLKILDEGGRTLASGAFRYG